MKHTNRLLLMMLIIGWISSCRSLGNPPIEVLLIDLSAFPNGWSEDVDGPNPIARAPLGGTKSVESIEISFYAYGGGAGERIRRFHNSQSAEREFNRQIELVFHQTEFNTPWVIPTELTFDSSSAHQFKYACSNREGSPWLDCAYLAQYGIYVVYFGTDMIHGYMDFSDFENVLRAIDDRMSFVVPNS